MCAHHRRLNTRATRKSLTTRVRLCCAARELFSVLLPFCVFCSGVNILIASLQDADDTLDGAHRAAEFGATGMCVSLRCCVATVNRDYESGARGAMIEQAR